VYLSRKCPEINPSYLHSPFNFSTKRRRNLKRFHLILKYEMKAAKYWRWYADQGNITLRYEILLKRVCVGKRPRWLLRGGYRSRGERWDNKTKLLSVLCMFYGFSSTDTREKLIKNDA
jgi:hypothetical protein